ncbi:leucine-rich_repeat domain-containing protein [Hexamita inflata]|uniref:Leucine-rich repeat domain-containing protein n=1 Tax=Hexamita inflata TaxID=28002 RepID=A0AA86Q325_9EUKA|nr:leucine-rich repeat domain-containing protein [Hexamita inflata]
MQEQQISVQYDEYMTQKYECLIQGGDLIIGDMLEGDLEVTNLRFIEKFNIKTFICYINNNMSIKFKSKTINELTLKQPELLIENINQLQNNAQQQYFCNIDDFELENLEVLNLVSNNLENDQLQSLTKFKKLQTLNVSFNNVDLTHIHSIQSLTKLSIQGCFRLKNIDQIISLVNLEDLDLGSNMGINICPLRKIKNLTKLSLQCGYLMNIDQIIPLTNLQVLNISQNYLQKIDSICLLINLKELNISSNKQIDITLLKDLVGLKILNMSNCNLKQLSALKSLKNLQDLDLSFNSDINITELQYLKQNLTYLNMICCDLVSICALRPLTNLKNLIIAKNQVVYLDYNLDDFKYLIEFRVNDNLGSDFSSIIKHRNFNKRNFIITNQAVPSKDQLFKANQMRNIECPNIQLIEIQNKHKPLKTTFNHLKQNINAAMRNVRSNQIMFTVNVVRLFQLLNTFGFE